MGSRDRSLQDKLKQYFKKGANVPPPPRNELVITPDLERELSAETPLTRRLKLMRELSDKVLAIKLHSGGVEKIWSAIRDLLEDPNTEARHTALSLLRAVAEGQADQLLIMRTVFLHWLRDTLKDYNNEDAQPRFKLLHTLTNSGKNITCFEDEIGPFLLEWIPQLHGPAQLVEFFELITNVVKFNAAYLDEDVIVGIVSASGQALALGASEVRAGIGALVAVVSYALFPARALPAFVRALCATVNHEHYTQDCWKLMRYVLGADVGHACVARLTELLADEAEAEAVARGAVFYLNMALWSARRVLSLRVSYLAVLPALLAALEAPRSRLLLAYEVLIAVAALVARCPDELRDAAYYVLLQILHRILTLMEKAPPNETMHTKFHDVLTHLETLVERRQFNGDLDQLYDLIDRCGADRSEQSVMRLVAHKLEALDPATGGWLRAAARIAERYSRHGPVPVRLHTLHAMHQFIQRHRELHAEEVLGAVALPVLGAAAEDPSLAVRRAAAAQLAELARHAAAAVCADLLDLLERIMNRPFERANRGEEVPRERDMGDVEAALDGLVALFHAKLFRAPAALSVRLYLILLQHVEQHYSRPTLFHHPHLRLKILEMFYSVRINGYYQVGFCYDANGQPVAGDLALQQRLQPTFSPYLIVDVKQSHHHTTPKGAAAVSLGRASRLVALVLQHERAWGVLAATLAALPRLLQHRPLAARHADVDMLANTLCAMVCNRELNLPEGLWLEGGAKLSQSEFHGAVVPVLAALAPYHACLEPATLQRVIRVLLRHGVLPRSPAPAIAALALFTLEARDAMVRMLPEVLLDLSKVSDTALIACPMLEFLSTLTRLPKVFASFVEDQYMSVFAILLPYTNPSRYNHYVVSLAHHVIAAWFLKCRLKYRRNFVKFIINGLHNYIIVPCEEQLFKSHNMATSNEDSTNRKRSSSLGSRGVPRAPLAGRGGGSSALAAFHLELTETCVDLLARSTFTPCSVKPQRTRTVEFLLAGGQSQTWLVGHKLITITTSGCLQNSLKQGLCERCATLCKQHLNNLPSPNPEPSDQQENEIKRQNSSENRSGTAEPSTAETQAQLSLKLDNLATQEWSRVRALAGGGQCPCWCAGWAELLVRSPSGDVSWIMRMQNQMNFDELLESPLQDVVALLLPSLHEPSSASASSGLGDSRHDVSSGSAPRSRSGSSSSRRAPPDAPDAPDLHKSSSDSVVAAEKKSPHAATHCIVQPQRSSGVRSTEPINIPGSPQRQSSSSTTDDDDTLIAMHETRSRHPVRRSNSSPEMSSSWKLRAPSPPPSPSPAPSPAPAPALAPALAPAPAPAMIVLPSCEPITTSTSLHLSRRAHKKSELRVSCEAIPEEQAHPTLMTYNSDPGTAQVGSSDTALDVLGARSPRHALQKVASDGSVERRVAPGPSGAAPPGHAPPGHAPPGHAPPGHAPPPHTPHTHDELPPLSRSRRSNTISVMSPTRRRKETSPKSPRLSGGGVTPAFVLLQLYHNMSAAAMPFPGLFGGGAAGAGGGAAAERPLLVAGAQHERSIKTLDHVPPLETYKVGVLYVGPGQQDNEVLILKNEYGSVRYAEFLSKLGSLVEVESDEPGLFLNLERGGRDGTYTYVWNDDMMQVQFHVATAMPCNENDPNCNEKLKYIGNDFVSIVYNDSGRDFNIHTIKGQLNFCIVVVEPLEHGINRVLVKSKDERVLRKYLAHAAGAWSAWLVSEASVALLARQLALHASLAALVARSLGAAGGGGAPYASNSLERLRCIKRLRERLEAERGESRAKAAAPYLPPPTPHTPHAPMDDFTEYT